MGPRCPGSRAPSGGACPGHMEENAPHSGHSVGPLPGLGRWAQERSWRKESREVRPAERGLVRNGEFPCLSHKVWGWFVPNHRESLRGAPAWGFGLLPGPLQECAGGPRSGEDTGLRPPPSAAGGAVPDSPQSLGEGRAEAAGVWRRGRQGGSECPGGGGRAQQSVGTCHHPRPGPPTLPRVSAVRFHNRS